MLLEIAQGAVRLEAVPSSMIQGAHKRSGGARTLLCAWNLLSLRQRLAHSLLLH